jgi:hypothetical protein
MSGRRGRARDESERPARRAQAWSVPPKRLRDAFHGLALVDDADVDVDDQGEGAAALPRAGVEDDRPGLCEREREGPPSAVRVPWVGADRDLERQLGQAARAAAAALAG